MIVKEKEGVWDNAPISCGYCFLEGAIAVEGRGWGGRGDKRSMCANFFPAYLPFGFF
jgi:hypothetical protein